jgi:hypothetical protein
VFKTESKVSSVSIVEHERCNVATANIIAIDEGRDLFSRLWVMTWKSVPLRLRP